MEQTLSWIATAATIAAASITASNLGSRITGYGFIVFTVGSISWFAFGLLSGQPALVWTNAVLILLNIFGVWRWLGRQARIEDGARAGPKASHRRLARTCSRFRCWLRRRWPPPTAAKSAARWTRWPAVRAGGSIIW